MDGIRYEEGSFLWAIRMAHQRLLMQRGCKGVCIWFDRRGQLLHVTTSRGEHTQLSYDDIISAKDWRVSP